MIQRKIQRLDGNGQLVTEEKYNHLAAVEMSREENYNQIDGVLTNKRPSFEERIRSAKARVKTHNQNRADRHKRERHERD